MSRQVVPSGSAMKLSTVTTSGCSILAEVNS
jgi:hypothetical protein